MNMVLILVDIHLCLLQCISIKHPKQGEDFDKRCQRKIFFLCQCVESKLVLSLYCEGFVLLHAYFSFYLASISSFMLSRSRNVDVCKIFSPKFVT